MKQCRNIADIDYNRSEVLDRIEKNTCHRNMATVIANFTCDSLFATKPIENKENDIVKRTYSRVALAT